MNWLNINWNNNFFYDQNWNKILQVDQPTADTSKLLKNYLLDEQYKRSWFDMLLNTLGIKTYYNEWAIWYIQMIVNYFLWILSFIALLVLLYWFFLMFLQKDSKEAISKSKKYIIASFISIILIWISFYLTSFIFYIILRR